MCVVGATRSSVGVTGTDAGVGGGWEEREEAKEGIRNEVGVYDRV